MDKTGEFETHRSHLLAVAHRLLGSAGDAEDALQEAWLRLERADTSGVQHVRAWLASVVARVCLDMLRSRSARREVAFDEPVPAGGAGPEREAVTADSVGLALLVVLDTLTPAERLAFVLHDVFALPFAEVAPIVGRSVPAAKMLASRARRRVHGAPAAAADPVRQRRVVEAFLAASRGGDFAGLLAVLDPDVTLHADASATGMPTRLRGAEVVARQALAFSSRARDARVGLADGTPAILVQPGGRLVTVLRFTLADTSDKITGIDIIADPAQLTELAVEAVG